MDKRSAEYTGSAGGMYEVSGTIGRHDAEPSGGAMAGGSFELVGGFGTIRVACTCTRDLTGDGRRDTDDIQLFVTRLIAGGACACTDMAQPNGATPDDVLLFVDGLLAGETCPLPPALRFDVGEARKSARPRPSSAPAGCFALFLLAAITRSRTAPARRSSVYYGATRPDQYLRSVTSKVRLIAHATRLARGTHCRGTHDVHGRWSPCFLPRFL